jgi:cytochrome c peroxidase
MQRRVRVALLVVGVLCLVVLVAGNASAGGGKNFLPLNPANAPKPPDLQRFIRDEAAAQKLGKALFWDMQAGSDGRTACASCHYAAGADSRSRNQLNPRGGTFTAKGPNAQLELSDFPITGSNVVGSQGVLPSRFTGIAGGAVADLQDFAATDADFHVGGTPVRRTTGRNTPSAINAVFNFRQFWDGRAQNEFNGVNPFGSRDPDARVGQVDASGRISKVAVSLSDASLASQSTGPPGNPVEMSADGRNLSDIGHKLMSLRPLGEQHVSPNDSLLGGLVDEGTRGLDASYSELIEQAFQPEWWNSADPVDGATRTYSLKEFNFPLFWGLAIQAYESTLVSDATPLDRFLRGDIDAMTEEEKKGAGVFLGGGNCSECHNGAGLSNATADSVKSIGLSDPEESADTGFMNIGVRPTADDPGNGGTDPFGGPLSETLRTGLLGAGVNGSFKTPQLRNVALTAPYFHNGGQGTLRDVVDFYDAGGNFSNPEKSRNIVPLLLPEDQKQALVTFLEDGLTDPRVRDQAAPFDHPQLFVPVGAQANGDGSLITENGRAVDCFKEFPATGTGGGASLTRFPNFTGGPCASVPTANFSVPKPPSSSPAAVAVTLPPAVPVGKSCNSRRKVTIKLYRPRRDRIKRMSVFVNGHRVASRKGRDLRRARVSLSGLAKGTAKVKIIVRTAKGRQIITQRKYKICGG